MVNKDVYINQLFILQTLVHTFFTVIMSYLKSIEIILLLIALFIAIAPDKRVICIISSVQKSIGQKSIQYVGIVLWNEIPQLLKIL